MSQTPHPLVSGREVLHELQSPDAGHRARRVRGRIARKTCGARVETIERVILLNVGVIQVFQHVLFSRAARVIDAEFRPKIGEIVGIDSRAALARGERTARDVCERDVAATAATRNRGSREPRACAVQYDVLASLAAPFRHSKIARLDFVLCGKSIARGIERDELSSLSRSFSKSKPRGVNRTRADPQSGLQHSKAACARARPAVRERQYAGRVPDIGSTAAARHGLGDEGRRPWNST